MPAVSWLPLLERITGYWIVFRGGRKKKPTARYRGFGRFSTNHRPGRLRLHDAVDAADQLALGGDADEGLARPVAALEDEHARDAGHAELGGDVGGVVHVQFADLDL